jgi:transposase
MPQQVARAALEAVAMDTSKAFEAETRAHCPHVEVVCGLFHLVAKYGREVIDRGRVDETSRIARAAGPGRDVLRAPAPAVDDLRPRLQ